jgi:hypothetical protein
MDKAKAANRSQPAARRDLHHPSPRPATGDRTGLRWALPPEDDFGGINPHLAVAVGMITPAAAALVIACALSPAITFVVLRNKGYSLLTASLGVATGALGLLIAIAAPSRLPAD